MLMKDIFLNILSHNKKQVIYVAASALYEEVRLTKQGKVYGNTNSRLFKLVELPPFSNHFLHSHVIVLLSYVPPLHMKLWILSLYLIYASRESTSLNLLAPG